MPEAVPRLPGAVSRRALLGRGAVLGGAALLLPWTAGCEAEAVPHEDVATLTGAITSEQNLIATYEAARSADASLAARLDPVLARHREHLAVLKRHHVPGSGDRADEGGAVPAPSPAPIPEGADVLAVLRAAEDRAAMARTADAAEAAPGLAQLLASIGACEAGHAMTATGKSPHVRSRSDAQAVRAALEAEHAAVYAYGVLGARLRGPLRTTAQTVWNDHRARRDALASVWSGASPVAGAAAYRLPGTVASARAAAEIAAKLEDGLVLAYVGLAGAASPDLRAFAADGARRARARAAAWRSRTGLPVPHEAFPGLPPEARSPRPVPGE